MVQVHLQNFWINSSDCHWSMGNPSLSNHVSLNSTATTSTKNVDSIIQTQYSIITTREIARLSGSLGFWPQGSVNTLWLEGAILAFDKSDDSPDKTSINRWQGFEKWLTFSDIILHSSFDLGETPLQLSAVPCKRKHRHYHKIRCRRCHNEAWKSRARRGPLQSRLAPLTSHCHLKFSVTSHSRTWLNGFD